MDAALFAVEGVHHVLHGVAFEPGPLLPIGDMDRAGVRPVGRDAFAGKNREQNAQPRKGQGEVA
jgi:hypothetical protein